MRGVSLITVRRVTLLEQRSPVNRPQGGWPAIIKDYDEWSALAEASQQRLRDETQGMFPEPAPEPVVTTGKRPPKRKPRTAGAAPATDPTKAYLAAQVPSAPSTAPAPAGAVPAWVTEFLKGQQPNH